MLLSLIIAIAGLFKGTSSQGGLPQWHADVAWRGNYVIISKRKWPFSAIFSFMIFPRTPKVIKIGQKLIKPVRGERKQQVLHESNQ